MKGYRRILLGLIFVIFAGFVATESTMKSDQFATIGNNPKIIYIYKTTKGEIEFWDLVTDGIQKGSEEFEMDFVILGAKEESDIAGNIKAVERAISLKPEVIVLAAGDFMLLEPVAQKVVNAGIILLTIDSNVDGEISRCFIGTDNYAVGQKMGREISARIPENGKVAIIGHVENSDTTIQRVKGAVDTITLENRQVISTLYCDNQPKLAREQVLKLLDDNPDIAGLLATNEPAAIGAAKAIEERGQKDKVSLITCDHTSAQIAFLESGVIDATIVQKPINMGYYSVQIAHALIKNEKDKAIPRFHDIESDIITKENYLLPDNQKLLFPMQN